MDLTETGLATGVFTGCIQSSDTYGQNPEDGLLYALAGDLITAEYKDKDSADDTCEPSKPVLDRGGDRGEISLFEWPRTGPRPYRSDRDRGDHVVGYVWWLHSDHG